MNDIQQKAWDCLKEDEQKSLFLQLSGGKSSWEAGVILKISHYKYLEVKERAEKFFKLFVDFFTLHPSIFRPNGPCDQSYMDYIEALIEKRMSRVEASKYTGSRSYLSGSKSKHIYRQTLRLKNSSDKWDHDSYRLISEFDRWNNFRILPGILQQPSAYKRRLNKKDKIYIRYISERLPEWLVDKLVDRFKYRISPKKPNAKCYWVCFISDLCDDGYYLVRIRPDKEVVDEMNRFYIYVFDDKEDADTFGFMVYKFRERTEGIRTGQNFWPEYRAVIQKAVNYNQVNNLEFGIKSLDNAYGINKPKKKKKGKSSGAIRVNPNLIYKL